MVKIARIFPFFLLAESFLTFAIKNLPEPFSSHLFWVLGWFAILLINYQLLLIKELKWVLIMLITYIIFFLFHKNHEESIRYINDAFNMIIPITVLEFYRRTRDFKMLSLFVKVFFVFIFTTAISSIIGFERFPESVRYNPAYEFDSVVGKSKSVFFSKMGIGNYAFFYGCAFSIPVLIYFIKNGPYKLIFYSALGVVYYSIIRSNYATAFILASVGLIFGLIGSKRFKINKILIVLFLTLAVSIPKSSYVSVIERVSNTLDQNSMLPARLNDLSYTIEYDDDDTHAGRRLERIPFLLSQFKASPIYGGGTSSGHVFWLDILSLYGIIGIIPFIMLFRYHILQNLKIFKEEFKYYYILSISLFIANGFFKGSGFYLIYLFIFLLIPAFNYVEFPLKSIARKRALAAPKI